MDVLINNAGINTDDDYNAENAEKTLRTNFQGTLNVRPRSRFLALNHTSGDEYKAHILPPNRRCANPSSHSSAPKVASSTSPPPPPPSPTTPPKSATPSNPPPPPLCSRTSTPSSKNTSPPQSPQQSPKPVSPNNPMPSAKRPPTP